MTQSHVATLIAAPATTLDAARLARAKATLPSAGEPSWLDPGIAADIPFTTNRANERAVSDALRGLFAGAPLDVVVQPALRRRKRLFLADMDSTMIGQECIDELADYVNLRAHVAAITERAMRGEIAFEPALRERVALLEGLKSEVVEEVIATRVRPTPGGRTLVATMRAHGAHTCLVSGGFTSFTAPIAAMIGFDDNRGNTLLLDAESRFSGRVQEPILGAQAKLAALLDLRQRLGLSKDDTLAIGDGANDLAMIEEAGLGVAFHAKPKVAAAAQARIDHGDLTALLYAQGYRREEFVEQ